MGGNPNSVSNAVFEGCGNGVYLAGLTHPISISGCSFGPLAGFSDNSGVYLNSSSSVSFSSNTLSGSYFQASVTNSSPVTLASNVLSGGSGLVVNGDLGTVSLSGNRGLDATRQWITINGTLKGNSRWSLQEGLAVQAGNLTIGAGTKLTLGPGMALHFGEDNSYGAYLTVLGSITGTAGDKAAFLTTEKDMSPYGGKDASLQRWRGIIAGEQVTTLSSLTVRHAATGVSATTVSGIGSTFELCSTGVSVSQGGGTFRKCTFTGNGLAIDNRSTYDVDARQCWFGDFTGPYNGTNNPTGRGNPVSDYVLFDWLPAKVLLQTKATAVRSGNNILVTLTVVNNGGDPAKSVRLSRAVLGTTVCADKLPIALGTLTPTDSRSVTLTFPAQSLIAGKTVILSSTQIYLGGSVVNKVRVLVP